MSLEPSPRTKASTASRWRGAAHGLTGLSLAAGVAVLGTAGPAQAQGLSGEEVYRSTCRSCHERGLMKAPVFGDRPGWAPLIRQGQAVLTAVAWAGIRRMPAQGGNPDLSLEEFARAVVHMANAAGAKWQDPDDAMISRIRAAEQQEAQRRQTRR